MLMQIMLIKKYDSKVLRYLLIAKVEQTIEK